MSHRSVTLFCLGLALVFASTSSAQERTAAVKEELRQRFTQEDYENYARKVWSGEIPRQGGPVGPSGTTDVLVNNNNGSIGTARFTQSETGIVAYGNFVIIGFNDAGSYTGSNNQFTGWSYSTNGGLSFTDGGTLPVSTIGDAGDPVLARNETTGRIYLSTLGFTSPSTIQMWRSDDNGVTWMAPTNATPGGSSEDKQWHTVDNFPGPGNGNVYMISRRFGTGPGIYVFRSTDHGATFGPSGGTLIVSGNQGAFIAVGPDHAVYAFWWQSGSIQMRKSTDFGVTFGSAITVASGLIGGTNGDLGLTGIRQGLTTASSFRSNEFPHVAINPISGNMYVTYANKGTGVDKADVFLTQSTDGGATWSAPFKVNDDATTTDQWQPTIAVTPAGNQVGIFYYSRQEDPTGNNLFKYYGRIGNIAGSTIIFQPSFAISDVPSLPEFGRDAVVNSVYMGDYNHAAATSSAFHVVWSDNRDDLPGGSPRKDPQVYYQRIPTTENFGWVRGTVTNTIGGAPVKDIQVDFTQNIVQVSGFTDSLGRFIAGVRVDTPGTTVNVTMRARKFGFLDTLINITITRNDTLTRNFAMRPLDLVLTKSSITFPPTPAPGTSRDSLVARNQGATPLTLSSLTTTNPRFTVSPTSGTIPPNDSVKIFVTYSPIIGGTDTGRVIVNSNSVYTPRRDVLLDGTAIGVPRFTASTDSVVRTLEGGARDSISFRMRNVGTASGNFSARAIMFPRTGPPESLEKPIIIPMTVQMANSPQADGYDPSPAASVSLSPAGSLDLPQYYNYNSGGSANTFPFNVDLGKRIQWLYLPGEFAQPTPAPAGRITRIHLRIATAGSGTFSNVTIALGQTNITTFPTGDWYSGPMQTVYTRSSVSFSAAVGEWVSIPLDIPFFYDPTLSLVVDITQCGRSGTGLSTFHQTLTGIRRNASQVSTTCPMPYANTSALTAHCGIDVSPGTWLGVAPTTGTVAIGDSILMTTRFDATDSSVYNNPGNYYGRIEVVATNSALAETLRVPARLFVVPAANARLSVNPDSVDFGNVEIGRTDSSKTVLVRNIGGATLNVTNITFSNPAFSSTRTSFSLASLDTIRLKLRFAAPSPGGLRTGTMTFVSNDPSAPTVRLRGNSVGVARIAVTPDSFYFSRPPGTDTTAQTLKIRNIGTDTLRYSITEGLGSSPESIIRSMQQQESYELPKGAIDPHPGQSSPTGRGGPDAFGYRWIDSDEPGGPPFSWFDIKSVGTQITTWTGSPDDGYATVSLPFTFSFYGNNYTSMNVITNGNAQFGGTSTAFTNTAIPSTALPNNAIYPFWDDLNFAEPGGTCWYYNDAANQRFIVQWDSVSHYLPGTTPGRYTFQLVLKPNGDILCYYRMMEGTLNSATIGIENSTGTVGLQVVFNANYVHDNLALLFTRDLVPWLSSNPIEGTIRPGDSTNVQVRVHPAGMAGGTYNARLFVSGNSPDTARIPVRLVVVTSVENLASLIPTQYGLEQNYPNPFNPSTKIRFALPHESHVRLKVYNILGQEVLTLADEMRPAGYFVAEWNGLNSLGGSVGTGVFFVRMEATSVDGTANYVSVKKMLLVK